MYFEPCTINYRVNIPIEKFKEKLLSSWMDDDSLYSILMNISGVDKVDYDGHFGPYVFFTLDLTDIDGMDLIDKKDAIEKKLEIIKDIIENFLRK